MAGCGGRMKGVKRLKSAGECGLGSLGGGSLG